MKASSLFRSPSSPPPNIFPIFNKLYKLNSNKNSTVLHNKFNAFSRFSLSSTPHHKPQTPLFLKPFIHKTTLSDLQTFLNWAKSITSCVGSSFEHFDNGPNSTLLLRELKWFLDDTIDDPLLLCRLGIPQNGEFFPRKVVHSRASLDQMYKLWEQRIVERRPFQYIVGCQHWRDLVLSVEEGVLIPRPETERIVDLVGDVGVLKEGLWADLGTGSGALAIGIARVLGGNGRVIGTDLSSVAVAVAKYNVERYGLQDCIEVRQGSWFEPLIDVEGELSGLVSNPPYIPSEDISGLQAEVGSHEPQLALDGGVEGMEHLIYLVKRTSTMLKPGGFFAFETNGEKQCKVLAEYMENVDGSSFRDVKIVPDFAGILRFVTGFLR